MSIDLYVIILIDDNTPAGGRPFENDPSLWSFREDYGLVGCKDYLFISAISGIRSQGEFTPLYAMRGLPDDFALSSTLGDKYQLDGHTGWLNASELKSALAHAKNDYKMYARPVRVLLEVIDLLAKTYGSDRVRLVFDIQT